MSHISVSRYPIAFQFAFLCLIAAITSWAFQFLLITETLYFNSFATQLSYERIEGIISEAKKLSWISYIIIPLIYFVKLSIITLCLSLGFFFISDRFEFKAFYKVAVLAELIFLLPVLIKLCWFLFVQTDYDLNDLTQFYPLSALTLVDSETIPRYWLAPLQTLNLFEVIYWCLLAYGGADATGFSFKRSFGLVMSSYGVGLVLWVVLVMFLTITYS